MGLIKSRRKFLTRWVTVTFSRNTFPWSTSVSSDWPFNIYARGPITDAGRYKVRRQTYAGWPHGARTGYNATLRHYLPLSWFIVSKCGGCCCNRTLGICAVDICLFVLNGFCDHCGRVKGADLHEQNVHQVLFKREKPASETFEVLTKALMMISWVKGKLLIGFHISKVVRHRQWSLNVQVAHRQVGLMKMRKKCVRFSMKITINDVCNILGITRYS